MTDKTFQALMQVVMQLNNIGIASFAENIITQEVQVAN
jgi:hypothetical protein